MSDPLVQWEGVVQEVKKRTFLANLALVDSSAEYLECKLKISSVPEEDRELVLPGAVFKWSIDADGTSVMRFSRERGGRLRRLRGSRSGPLCWLANTAFRQSADNLLR